jgi:sigma-B regulation protein RsbU (phosphoserine phosphatase)
MQFLTLYGESALRTMRQDSYANRELLSLKTLEHNVAAATRVRVPLVLKIVSIFFVFSVSEIFLIWLSVGSNQIRLVSEKALLASEKTTQYLSAELLPILNGSDFLDKILTAGTSAKDGGTVEKILRVAFAKEQGINALQIVTPEGNTVYAAPLDTPQARGYSKKAILPKLLSALQAFEFSGAKVYASSNVFDYSMDVFMPLRSAKNAEVILMVNYQLPFIRRELSSLFRLAWIIVSVTVLLQLGFAFLIYRLIVLPVRRLERSAARVAAGDLATNVAISRGNDEIENLTTTFNQMVSSLNEKSTKLQHSIKILERNQKNIVTELDMARDVQHSFLPQHIEADRLRASVYYRPLGQVSGDYYDVIPLPGGKFGFLLFDVSGHGVPAALITIMARSIFHTLGRHCDDPAVLLNRANEELCANIKTGDFLTAFCLFIDGNNELIYANAGHPAGIILKRNGEIRLLETTGILIGAVENLPEPLTSAKVRLDKGDRIILYTDGFIESCNAEKEPYTSERLIQKISNSQHEDLENFHQALVSDFEKYISADARGDDVTLICLEVKG